MRLQLFGTKNTCIFLMAFSADFLVLYATKPYPIDSIAPKIKKNTFNCNFRDASGSYFVNRVCKLAKLDKITVILQY